MSLPIDQIYVDNVAVGKPDVRLWMFERRYRLFANRTYYVRPDGSDANDGLASTAGSAFASLQRAADVVHRQVDTNGFACTVEVAPGTYNAGMAVDGPFTGGGPVIFNTASYPSATIVNAPVAFQASNGAKFTLTGGFKPQGVSQNLVAIMGGKILFSGINFGSGGAGCIHAYATRHGYIEALASYLVSAGGSNHVQASHHGNFRQSGGTVILNANVTFSHSTYYALTEADITITGDSTVSYGGFTCSAKKFLVSAATIQWSSQVADALLGSLPGEEYSGGRFLGADTQTDTFPAYFTLDMSATGDQAITMPFWAHEVDWWAAKAGTTASCENGKTIGFANHCLVNAHVAAAGARTLISTACIYVYDGSVGNIFQAAVTARTHTSITLTKAKTGTPTGTLDVAMVATRRS